MISISEIVKEADRHQLWASVEEVDATHFVVDIVHNSNYMEYEIKDDFAYARMRISIGPTIDCFSMDSISTFVTDTFSGATHAFHDTDLEGAFIEADIELADIATTYYDGIFDGCDYEHWEAKQADEEAAWALHNAE